MGSQIPQEPVSTCNIEHFLKKLTLEPMVHADKAPPMPEPNERSVMTPLIMKPGGYRKLREIKRIDSLENEVTFFFNNLNSELGGCAEFKSLSLASQISTQKVKETLKYNPYEVNNRNEVMFAVERAPLRSVQMLVHTIDEELRQWSFHTPRRNETLNNQGVEPIFFTKLDASHGMESVKCIVVALAPWEFSPQDFQDFTSMSEFIDGNTSTNGERNHMPWQNADKMWAYLHDLCLIHDCRYFVLTTYEQWAFGGFSTFFTTSFISEVKYWDAEPNSILEMFTYWMLAACSFHNSVMLHEVPLEEHADYDLFERERQSYGKRLLNDGLGPDTEVREMRPAKRARKDYIEERVGWQPLSGYSSTTFHFPRIRRMTLADRAGLKDQRRFTFAQPSTMWNSWQKKRAREEKENSSQLNSETANHERSSFPVSEGFLRPIPCYFIDGGPVRPDVISLESLD